MDAFAKLVSDWEAAKKKLAKAAEAELALRLALASSQGTLPEGTSTFEVDAKRKLKIKTVFNYNLDRETLPVALKALKANGVDTDELVKFDPRLSLKAYRELGKDDLVTLSGALSIKPGTPQLEVVAVEKKKSAKSTHGATSR